MRGDGLVEVPDASRFFIESEQPPVVGKCGDNRPGGDAPAGGGDPGTGRPGRLWLTRRATTGIDTNRILMLIAVLARHAGLNLTGHDVYVNVAGGLTIEEPSADLAIAAALASSLRERPVRHGTVLAGELALVGAPAARKPCRTPVGGGATARLRPTGDRVRARWRVERRGVPRAGSRPRRDLRTALRIEA